MEEVNEEPEPAEPRASRLSRLPASRLTPHASRPVDEPEAEAAKTTGRKRTTRPWESVGSDWANWTVNRSRYMEADKFVDLTHSLSFPPVYTFAQGYVVTGGYTGGIIYPGDEVLTKPFGKVEGVLKGVHNFASLRSKVALDELEAAITYPGHPAPTLGKRGVASQRLVRELGKKDQLAHCPSAFCEEPEERRWCAPEVSVSEVKWSRYPEGGCAHSDGCGATDLTLGKIIMKPQGGSLLVEGVDGIWRFVNIDPSEWVFLSTWQGARLHCAARLEFVKELACGTHVFRQAAAMVLPHS